MKFNFTNNFKKSLKIIFITIIIFLSVFSGCHLWIKFSTRKQIFNSLADLPENKIGLVLGTSKKASDGNKNMFFFKRIKAAAILYKKGKIKKILVSGDNRSAYYDEPTDMKKALVALGVPDSVIVMDYAGLRTFDSVIRCYKIFGQSSFTIISQQFQNERGIFIANHQSGISAVAFNSESVSLLEKPGTYLREMGARFKCILDIYILNTEPKILGKKEKID